MKKHKHGFHTSHVTHHSDNSHTIHHMHSEGSHKDVKHAVGNLDALHDSLEDHIGAPNEQEGAANAGDHGVPEAQAAPAGLPAPAAPMPNMPGQGA